MYNFEIEEHRTLRTSIQRLLQKALPEFQSEAHYNTVPRALFKQLAELGLTGLAIEEKYGGLGSDPTTSALVMEELAAADLGPAIFISVHNMVAGIIQRGATEEVKSEILPRMASGDLLGAFALSEPSAGSDASALKTKIEKQVDHYVLNGQKCWISSAGYADVYVTFARHGTADDAGITGIILPPSVVPTRDSGVKERSNTEGSFKISRPEKKMGCELSPIASLFFENLRVPTKYLLGQEQRGYAIALGGLAGGRISIASCANGLSRTALQRSLAHLKEREQFGNKLIEFQGLQFMLADMQMKFEAARLLTREAASILQDNPQNPDNRLFPSYAKCFATDAAMSITTDAVQLLGGAGYVREYEVEKLMRDAKMLQIVEGTNQIQRMVIARELSRRNL